LSDVDISSVFEDIKQQIEVVKTTLTEEADSLIGPIQDNIGDIFTQTGGIVDDMKSVRDDYFPYFKTATLVLGSFFVVVLAIFLLGVCCGSCSKRGGTTASTAATVLFSTNILLILLAVLLFILTTSMFTVGALSQKFLCKTLEEPAESELLTFVSPLISNELGAVYGNDSVTIDVAEVIQNIHSGMALYPLLQLKYIYDIDGLADWKNEFDVEAAIQTGRDLIDQTLADFNTTRKDFEGSKDAIVELGGSVDDALLYITSLFSPGELIEEIEASINQLEVIKDNLPTTTQLDDLRNLLENVIKNAGHILNTLKDANELFTTTIGDLLKPEGTMSGKIEATLDSIDDAFNLLMDGTSPYYIPTFFNDSIIAPILVVVDDYVQFAIDSANNDIGETSPLSNIYKATIADVCQEIVNPFNAVWSGLGWCLLLLLLPVTLVIHSLRKLYCTSKRLPALRQFQSTDKGRPPMDRAVSYTEVPLSHLSSQHPQHARYPVPDKYKAQR